MYVAPRSREYGDVTATYIRRSEIPSRIYVKHQCRQESEYGSTVVIYIPTEKYKYIVITESDTILQEYYITRRYKSTIYKRFTRAKGGRCSRAGRRNLKSQLKVIGQEDLLSSLHASAMPL